MEPPTTIAVIPVNMKDVRASIAGIPIPKPSIEHSLIDCGICGGPAWIGPAQLMHFTFNGGLIVCYHCLPRNGDETWHTLDWTADDKPRRT